MQVEKQIEEVSNSAYDYSFVSKLAFGSVFIGAIVLVLKRRSRSQAKAMEEKSLA